MPEAQAPVASPLPARGTVLGFDFGLARIGVAVGELETRHASALETVHATNDNARFSAIAQLVATWQPVAAVVGMPFALDGGPQALTGRCQRFSNQLRGRLGLTVFEFDERLSSHAAEADLRNAGARDWRTRKDRLDAAAARIILQNFLDHLPA